MGAQEWWIVANIITLAFIGPVILIMVVQLDAAKAKAAEPCDTKYLARWRRRNVRFLQRKIAINAGVATLGLMMIGWALRWPDPPVGIPIGTSFFTLIWVGYSLHQYADWREMGEINRLAEIERNRARNKIRRLEEQNGGYHA